jgi:hypothetical protein
MEPQRGDRAFTYRVTFASLTFGVIAAVTVGLLLLSLRQPLTTNADGSVIWSLGMFMVPLAGFASIAILAWSVFSLPVSLAGRASCSIPKCGRALALLG